MGTIISILLGTVVGWLGHSLTMKTRFKEKTIEHKVRVYDKLLEHWVTMRNYVFSHHSGDPQQSVSDQVVREFDQIYGQTQRTVAQAFLVCGDVDITEEINALNERMYRTEWSKLDIPAVNVAMEEFKEDAFNLVQRMRKDIERDTRIGISDITHMFGFSK